jgi:predicted nucleic acid-binding protein
MSVLVDTNIWLRRVQPNHPLHKPAVECVGRLLDADEALCFTPQNIAEFWNVMTRPVTSNGLGFSTSQTSAEVAKIEAIFTLLSDTPAIYVEWKRLVSKHNVQGVQVHDSWLVASMNVHGVERLLTFNSADFARFGISLLYPSSL